jgi:hypothetical protein
MITVRGNTPEALDLFQVERAEAVSTPLYLG